MLNMTWNLDFKFYLQIKCVYSCSKVLQNPEVRSVSLVSQYIINPVLTNTEKENSHLHILLFWDYWALPENRILLKQVLGVIWVVLSSKKLN